MNRSPWTIDQIDKLYELYPNHHTAAVAKAVGRTVQSCYTKAQQLGLKKSDAFYQSDASHRLKGQVGAGTRFKPGHATWNKGMKGLDIGGKETRFKPGTLNGRARDQVKPIGFERLSKEGYLQRKVNNELPFNRRWKFVHVILWEESNGPVPAGHMLAFINGDRTDIRLDNLQLITRREMMQRNTYHQYGKQIATLVQLKGAVTRQINKRSKA